MRNEKSSKIATIFTVAEKLPFFTIDDLTSMETDRQYLRVLLSRSIKSGRAVRLKKGMYVAGDYVHRMETSGAISAYPEFLSGTLYAPSYVSLEYILYKHNILTDVPVNFTAVTLKKTASFSNTFGTFIYHTIRNDLFTGYTHVREGGFTFLRASKAKALFDYCYFRKNTIADRRAVDELRLNLGEFESRDRKELALYINKEGSKKMKEIYRYLF